MSRHRPSLPSRMAYRLLPILAVLILFTTLSPALAHWGDKSFHPQAPVDLLPLLHQSYLSEGDYQLLFLQTGLARPGVDALLSQGTAGVSQILDTQEAFFQNTPTACLPPGNLIREDFSVDEAGNPIQAFPLAPLEEGDVLLSFSAHTLGWRHGHAGLVSDATGAGTILEAVRLGENTALIDAAHWATYSTYLHLRLSGITPQQQGDLTDFIRDTLNDIPYHLFSGLRGADKAPNPADEVTAQCAYLVWYAFWQLGYDVDANGGRLVTVADLARSPLFEVVQVYGMDPKDFLPPKA